MYRLRDLARSFIYRLRKVAPMFYEEKLPRLVNQAASTLLTFDTSTKEGNKKFHETHAYFLLVLQDLRKSQPAGEVNFQNEKKRFEERARLIKRQAALDKMIDELEAVEFDCDELGEEDFDTKYMKVTRKIDELKKEQLDVNMQLAFIEGEKIEEIPDFKLRVKPNSILNRLTKAQLDDLEDQMLTFYKLHNRKKTAMYVDKSIIDQMIENLNIEKGKFQLEELRHISKDALDAYKSYYREKEQELREEYYKILLENERLRPKEGIILDNPECLPEHVKRQLERNASECLEKTQNLIEVYSSRQDTEPVGDEELSDSDTEEGTSKAERVITKLKSNGIEYSRVREAPRDDYIPEEEDDDYESPMES